jgi:hypothetical protein
MRPYLRLRTRGKVRLALIGIAVTLALAACGSSASSSSGVTAAAYVKSACSAIATWKNDVAGDVSKLQTATGTAKTMARGKAEFVVFVTSLVAATRKAATGLVSAGVPNVKDGKQSARTLSQAFNQASTSLAGTIAEAKAIPTTNAAAYQAALSGVSDQFKSSLNNLASASPKRNDQLRVAAAKDPTCKALNSG